MPSICPLENQVARALNAAGIAFMRENETPAKLDFYLPKYDLHVEVKSGASERTGEQLKRAQNVIVLQGMKSVDFFCAKLTGQ